jgi:two-component system chemotaxis response regulator CheY
MKLLLIDDSQYILKTTIKILSIYLPDTEIITANNGMKGFELYQSLKPDVIITDLLMPELDGQGLIAKIRENDKLTRIFVISADIQTATKTEVQNYGVSGFINKPINEEKIATLATQIKGD